MEPGERLVAVELTSRGLAFGVLEGEERLIDWGTRECGRRVPAFLEALSGLIERYRPDRLVLEEPAGSYKKDEGRTLLAWAEQWAADHELPVETVTPQDLTRYFGSSSRHAIAVSVARQFSRLAPQLPERRRRWESEPARLAVFVAIGRALSCYRKR